MSRFATVEDYLAALPPELRDVARAAHDTIDSSLPEAQCAIKWAHPTWSIGKRPICYLKAASAHVTFGFWRGAAIDDRSGRLQTTGAVMAHAKLRALADVDPALFADWLAQARALETGVRAQER
jgi:uncharacterized protein YdhG (YjbR/CyaY superfamily)